MKVYLVLRVVDMGDRVHAVCKTMANAELRMEQLKQEFQRNYNLTPTQWDIEEVELEE